MDSKARSIIKAITWRILGLLTTITVSFAILGNWTTSAVIGIVSNILKTLFYYIHERLWQRTKWGEV